MDPTTLSTGALVSVLVTEAIEMVKQSPKFAWFNMQTQTANRWLGMAVAFLTGLGIHFQFSGGTLVVTGLVWASLGQGLLQWAQQQVYYRLIVKGTK